MKQMEGGESQNEILINLAGNYMAFLVSLMLILSLPPLPTQPHTYGFHNMHS